MQVLFHFIVFLLTKKCSFVHLQPKSFPVSTVSCCPRDGQNKDFSHSHHEMSSLWSCFIQVCNILNSPPERQWSNFFSAHVKISHLSYLRSHTPCEQCLSVILYDVNQTSESKCLQREALWELQTRCRAQQDRCQSQQVSERDAHLAATGQQIPDWAATCREETFWLFQTRKNKT